MKHLNCTIASPTYPPRLRADEPNAPIVFGRFESSSRVIFDLPDTLTGGGTIFHHGNGTAEVETRCILPDGAEAEGPALLPASAPPLTINGAKFVPQWRGVSSFRLAERIASGFDVTDLLKSYVDIGANLVRVFGMKADNTGWSLDPRTANYTNQIMRRTLDVLCLYVNVEWTVLCDTKFYGMTDAEQITFWNESKTVAADYPSVALELVNERGHPTQALTDLDRFERSLHSLCSHGSGMEDSAPVEPFWDYATYHARRSVKDVRRATNYNPYEFQARYPMPCPMIADEGAKPVEYGYDTGFAFLMGQHARIGAGATFHHQAGVNSDPLVGQERDCADAFFKGLS